MTNDQITHSTMFRRYGLKKLITFHDYPYWKITTGDTVTSFGLTGPSYSTRDSHVASIQATSFTHPLMAFTFHILLNSNIPVYISAFSFMLNTTILQTPTSDVGYRG
jgi:hypothetical protein